ncbi:hypothetical protein F5887DRAFT_143029 [Amanita rubescens]|nr:hypothetical protein F5887DRAFT_143029 [Amanita rubescens]
MKAVLLLHPNISLYSSDALPINCSAYSYNPDALRPTPPRPSSDVPSRTCECLTQTLCCHGCGSAVGYMIVIPCNRCTGSFTSTNRATNGHRFIFYSGEVIGTERHYVPDEPGVLPYESFAESPALSIYQASIRHSVDPQPPGATIVALPGSFGSSSLFRTHSSHSHASSLPETTSSDSAEVKETRPPCKLRAGDILFWHHLSRHGEIPGVADDPRARRHETNTTTPPRENASYR